MYYGQQGKPFILLLCGGDRAHKRRILSEHMCTGKAADASAPFRAANHLRSHAEIAAYIEAMLEDGDARAVPAALRTVSEH